MSTGQPPERLQAHEMNVSVSVPLFSAASAAQGLDLPALLRQVIDSERYVLGSYVNAFEAAFALYLGVDHAIGVANGTDALELALRGLGIGHGHRVLTVANAGFYGSTAILATGAEPVYADVDPTTLNLAPQALADALQQSQPIHAVIATHLYGQMADVTAIASLCHAAGVPLIEDCAQAHGARHAGRAAGAWGDVGCFSFYPTKNLGAVGDGGALVTTDDALAERLRALRQYGWGSKYEVVRRGGRNSRLDELQAAVLVAKLPLLDSANAQRRSIAMRYTAAFAGTSLKAPVIDALHHVAHLYVIRSPRRGALRAHLAACGVASDIHYPVPDHRQPVHAGAYSDVTLPVSEAACRELLTLPCFPGMTDVQVAHVIETVNCFLEDAA